MRYIFFENKNDGIFTFKEQQDDVISISIGGRQICRNLIVLPFCTNTPYGINKMPWQKVALEANINVDFSEIKISAAGGENDYNVVFVCSDEPVDESRGFDFFETKKIPLIQQMSFQQSKALVNEAYAVACQTYLDDANKNYDVDHAKWQTDYELKTEACQAWTGYNLALNAYNRDRNIYNYQAAFAAAFATLNNVWKKLSAEAVNVYLFDWKARENGFDCNFRARCSKGVFTFGCTDENGDFIKSRYESRTLTPSTDLSSSFPDHKGPMGDGDYYTIGLYSIDAPAAAPQEPTRPEGDEVTQATSTDVINSKTFTDQLRQDYAKCTGVFVTPRDASTDFSQVTASLKIAQNEILPLDFDLSLIAFTGEVCRQEATYDFAADNIPARSSELEFSVTNPTDKDIDFKLYLVLENR